MADRVRAFLEGDFNDALGDNGAGEGGAEKVVAFILGAGLEGGEYIIFNEFLLEVFDVKLACAGLDGLFLKSVKLGALTYVAGYGDDLGIIIV